MGKHRITRDAAFFLLIMVLVLVMIYSGLRVLESTVFYREEETEKRASKTITRDGVDYFPRQDITVIMVLGIDRTGPVEASGFHRNSGAADMIMLLVFDEKKETCRILQLNRDTMLDMSTLGVRGEYAGAQYGQLALAHTYGSGLADSCENVKNTLEQFLHGMSIDYYLAMNMDAVAILNDAVGGVTVEVRDDFSGVDPSLSLGSVTLKGQQALNFVQSRGGVGDERNVSRMERQKAYLKGFAEAFRTKQCENEGFLLKIYDETAPYLVSDLPVNTLSAMLERYETFTMEEILSLKGENRRGQEHYEFYPDEEALEMLILELFYMPK